MGAEYGFYSFEGMSRAEFMTHWSATKQQDGYDRGHEMYSGSLVHVDSERFLPNKYTSFKQAHAALQDMQIQKGTAVVVQVGTPDVLPAKLAKIRDAAVASQLASKAFAVSIAYRTMNQKSKTKGCSQCECSFSKKGLDRIWGGLIKPTPRIGSDADLEKLFNKLAVNEDGFLERRAHPHPAESWFLACPICTQPGFLVTDTDRKKFKVLEAKRQSAETLWAKEKPAYFEKERKAGREHGWYVLACTPI